MNAEGLIMGIPVIHTHYKPSWVNCTSVTFIRVTFILASYKMLQFGISQLIYDGAVDIVNQ